MDEFITSKTKNFVNFLTGLANDYYRPWNEADMEEDRDKFDFLINLATHIEEETDECDPIEICKFLESLPEFIWQYIDNDGQDYEKIGELIYTINIEQLVAIGLINGSQLNIEINQKKYKLTNIQELIENIWRRLDINDKKRITRYLSLYKYLLNIFLKN
jgi:hypothetical protein